MELTISIIGAIVAIIVSIAGAILANSIILQTRKLKESHYIKYIASLHNLCEYNNDKKIVAKYVEARVVLSSVDSPEVISSLITYEEKSLGCPDSLVHDEFLTLLIKSIRKDLKLTN